MQSSGDDDILKVISDDDSQSSDDDDILQVISDDDSHEVKSKMTTTTRARSS